MPSLGHAWRGSAASRLICQRMSSRQSLDAAAAALKQLRLAALLAVAGSPQNPQQVRLCALGWRVGRLADPANASLAA